MITPDLINGIFEATGAFFIALSIRKLYQDNVVRGVSWVHVAFFAAWGFWNLYYYPALDQWFSFWGGVGIVTTNTALVIMMLYYIHREKRTLAGKGRQ